ncbi:TPA: MBL fold metallo-hydrolase [Candidatus Woesearchaeota archaeon]|nr:MBL fold metallo-hydrolase [Candidatus Woesearchaeota archaeon]HIH31312.1 MBL fold metallo-hydrolase [Candidatus Woesearchaeota archaeon]HIH55397.1 MBL fold metallo-hydrolase [Candidatus Woesearchaeota archaeon]HIJ01589.1 MBL fold metallo-hydrolase [Candidatus Woesearchaeota archaeon]HIJ14588.1 MBL fold metallo-hydrolase [Candidatus Woesearchaeota archaeon]
MIEIMPVGGYREVGRNCTAVKVDDEVIVLDLGLHLQNYIHYTQDEDEVDLSYKKLIEIEAVPDITEIEHWMPMVKAICISHAHLDHIGAAPFLASKFKCPIHGTPYTIEVLKVLLEDKEIKINNKLVAHEVNSIFKVSDNIKIEFISITHSIIHTAMVVIHTKYGSIVYANDFKLDNQPTLGLKSNIGRMKQLSNVKVMIMDSLYANKPIKTPSESVAKELLREVMISTNSNGKAMIVSTFSSHLARIKSILEFAKQLNRKVVFLGRSLEKYIRAGENIKVIEFSKTGKIIKYRHQIQTFLKKCKKPEDYVFIVTGHQGEPKSVLARMIFNNYFNFKKEDIVIFSCTIIPGEENIKNREKMENELKKKRVRIFRDIHVSGHGAREDARDLINMINPKNLIPTHSEIATTEQFLELAEELGYRENKNVFLLRNGAKINIK